MELFTCGVNGILQPKIVLKEIIPAINAVRHKRPYFCSETMREVQPLIKVYLDNGKIFHPNKDDENMARFTARETDIIKLICEGYTNKEIGDYFGISMRTIESTREMILKKSETKNTAGIVVYAIRNKIFNA